MATRQVVKRYHDPLDLVWIHCANELGIAISRDDEVFASWDGKGTLRLGTDSLDEDDSLAQMVLHELCHSLIEGPTQFETEDWGLNGPVAKSRVHEFAALRLQASFADRFQMRGFFAATTDFREYYMAIPSRWDSLLNSQQTFQVLKPVPQAEDARAIEMARLGLSRCEASSWRQAILSALESTRKILEVVEAIAGADSMWNMSDEPDP